VVLHVLDQRLLDPIAALFSEAEKEELMARLRRQAHDQYAQLIAVIDSGKAECELFIVAGVPFLKIVQFAHDLDVDVIVMVV
jgi:nucleotide-binding universal stress UspA family protein